MTEGFEMKEKDYSKCEICGEDWNSEYHINDVCIRDHRPLPGGEGK